LPSGIEGPGRINVCSEAVRKKKRDAYPHSHLSQEKGEKEKTPRLLISSRKKKRGFGKEPSPPQEQIRPISTPSSIRTKGKRGKKEK